MDVLDPLSINSDPELVLIVTVPGVDVPALISINSLPQLDANGGKVTTTSAPPVLGVNSIK